MSSGVPAVTQPHAPAPPKTAPALFQPAQPAQPAQPNGYCTNFCGKCVYACRYVCMTRVWLRVTRALPMGRLLIGEAVPVVPVVPAPLKKHRTSFAFVAEFRQGLPPQAGTAGTPSLRRLCRPTADTPGWRRIFYRPSAGTTAAEGVPADGNAGTPSARRVCRLTPPLAGHRRRWLQCRHVA